MVTLGLSILAIAWALMMLTPTGQLAYAYMFYFLEYYAGVFSLVLLSMTVMGGLLATDRVLLGIKHRVLLQSTHRVGGIGAVGFLALHIATKISMGKASVIDIAVPFMSPFNTLYIGLGTIASYFMLTVFFSGLLRHRFINRAKPWVWRGIHALSYVSWPIAIMHGLTAGRAAKTWVTVSYVVCLVLVTVALFLRLAIGNPRGKAGGGTMGGTLTGTGTGSFKPIRVPVAGDRQPAEPVEPTGPARAGWSSPPPPRGPREERYDDYEPYDNGYIDLPARPISARPVPAPQLTEQIPVQDERERRRREQEHLYGRPKAEEYDARRARLERYEEPEELGYVPRRSAERPALAAREQAPISGPPRHRLVEDNTDAYVPTNARIPTPTYVGTARPRTERPSPELRPFQELAPDDTPTLIDMATRRAARDSGERWREPETRFREPRDFAAPGRGGRRRRTVDGDIDERYWVS
jgi:hypothetical protein